MAIYDQERDFLLRELAAGLISEDTPLVDLRRLYFEKSLTDNVVPVRSGQSVAEALLAAQAMGPSATNRITILLHPGTHDLGETSLQMVEYVDLVGSGKESTRLVYYGTGLTKTAILLASNCSIRDLSVENTNYTVVGEYCIGTGTSDVENVSIRDCNIAAWSWGIAFGSNSTNVEIDRCYIESCNPVWCKGTDIRVTRNTMYFNGNSAFTCFAPVDANGIVTRATIAFNSAYMKATNGAGLYILQLGGDDNLVMGNDFTVISSQNGRVAPQTKYMLAPATNNQTSANDANKPNVFCNNRFAMKYEDGVSGDQILVCGSSAEYATKLRPAVFSNNLITAESSAALTVKRFNMTGSGIVPVTLVVHNDGLRGTEEFEDNIDSDIEISTPAFRIMRMPSASAEAAISDAQLDSCFGEPGDVGSGFTARYKNTTSGSEAEYIVWSDGTSWFYVAGTEAA